MVADFAFFLAVNFFGFAVIACDGNVADAFGVCSSTCCSILRCLGGGIVAAIIVVIIAAAVTVVAACGEAQ